MVENQIAQQKELLLNLEKVLEEEKERVKIMRVQWQKKQEQIEEQLRREVDAIIK